MSNTSLRTGHLGVEIDIEPDCPQGFSMAFLAEKLDSADFKNLRKWMYGQTMSLCDGRRYDHEACEYKPTECAGKAHGGIIYAHDFYNWCRRGPILD